MARVTVEDCIVQVPNRFDLVLYAAQRAREIAAGSVLHVERDRDKNPVVALREIAEERLSLPALQEQLVKGLQHRVEPDKPEEEVTDLMVGEQQQWVADQDKGAEDDEIADIDDEEAAIGGEAQFEDAEVAD